MIMLPNTHILQTGLSCQGKDYKDNIYAKENYIQIYNTETKQ